MIIYVASYTMYRQLHMVHSCIVDHSGKDFGKFRWENILSSAILMKLSRSGYHPALSSLAIISLAQQAPVLNKTMLQLFK